MQLSVEVKRQDGKIVFFCRGSLLHGQASEYLFDLVTRSCCEDVVLDLAGIREFDAVGLRTLTLTQSFLNTCHRRFALQHAPFTLLDHLRHRYDETHHIFALFEPGLVQTSATSSR